MRDMRVLVRRLAGQGMTVLLSSHLMGEVEELCDRVAIVRAGRVVHEGSLAELIATSAGRYELRTTDDERALAIARGERGVQGAERVEGALRMRAAEDAVARLSIALGEASVGIVALVPR